MSEFKSRIPQTNALQHLIDMISGAKDGEQTGSGSTMPIMSPQAWMQQGAGSFMPMSTGQTSGASQGKGGVLGSQGGKTGKGGGG
jgi:hypothetical protein